MPPILTAGVCELCDGQSLSEAVAALGQNENSGSLRAKPYSTDIFPSGRATVLVDLNRVEGLPQVDEDMLAAGLQSQAPDEAFIASKTRASAVLQYLREANLSEEQIARLKYPAGLNIGSVTPEEIALSILAEIVQRRRPLPIAQSPVLEALDPVCGMTVEIVTARLTSEYAGMTYDFCDAGCKRSFDKEPRKYVPEKSSQL